MIETTTSTTSALLSACMEHIFSRIFENNPFHDRFAFLLPSFLTSERKRAQKQDHFPLALSTFRAHCKVICFYHFLLENCSEQGEMSAGFCSNVDKIWIKSNLSEPFRRFWISTCTTWTLVWIKKHSDRQHATLNQTFANSEFQHFRSRFFSFLEHKKYTNESEIHHFSAKTF